MSLLRSPIFARRLITLAWLLAGIVACGDDTDLNGDQVQPNNDAGGSVDNPADGSSTVSPEPDPFEQRRAELCATLDCGSGTCDPFAGECSCPSGTFFDGRTCVETVDCEPPTCDRCPPPWIPALRVVAASELLPLRSLMADATVEVHVALDSDPDADLDAPRTWSTTDTIPLESWRGELIRLTARHDESRCPDGAWATRTIAVADDYGAPATEQPTDALSMDADIWADWASEVVAYVPGDDVAPDWADPTLALGAATGDSFDVVSLGEGGQVTLGFTPAIRDGEGWDLAVFENSFSDTFLELAWVEVSSDGVHFARIDSASLTSDPVDAFGGIEPRRLGGLAGKFRRGFGSPVDLAQLRQHPLVQRGLLDLHNVRQVRVVDVVGAGQALDSFERPIQDPFPTVESAGFDLEAIGALHTVAEVP